MTDYSSLSPLFPKYRHTLRRAGLTLTLSLGLVCSLHQPARSEEITWKLSPQAEYMYNYLLLAEAMQTHNKALILEAMLGMLKVEPSLDRYQESIGILLSQHNLPAAKNLALQGLQHFPNDVPLNLLLATTYIEQNEYKLATETLEKFIKKNPNSQEVLQELARLYVKTEQFDKAQRILDRLSTADPSDADIYFKARILAAIGKLKEARKVLLDFAEQQPHLVDTWTSLAAVEIMDKNLEGAIRFYEKALTLTPDTLEIGYRIVLLQLENKKTEEAVATALKLPGQPKSLIQASLIFAEKNFLKEAKALLEESQKAGANPVEITFHLALVQFKLTNNAEEAVKTLDTIPSSNSFYFRAILRKYQIFMEIKAYDRAADVARQARAASPEQKEFWSMEAVALNKMQKYQAAQDLLQEGLTQNPNDTELLFSLGHLQSENNETDNAISTMERIIAVDPQHFKALNFVGYSLAEQNKDLQRALQLITTALELSPDSDYIIDSLAWVQYRLGQYTQAWETIQRCLATGSDDAAIWEHYGDIALALKKKQEAIKGYTEAIDRAPENLESIKKKLKALQ